MSLSGALPQTLRALTATKIAQLSTVRETSTALRTSIYSKADQQESARDRVQVLVNGLMRLMGGSVAPETSHEDGESSDSESEYEDDEDDDGNDAVDFAYDNPVPPTVTQNVDYCRNIRRFLCQSRHNTSINPETFTAWEQYLRGQIDLLSVKHDHSVFFSQLITEWLGDPDAFTTPVSHEGDEDARSEVESFEALGREEKYEQRAEWEKLVFDARDIDESKVEEYLQDLFSTKKSKKALKGARHRVKSFGDALTAGFSSEVLKWVIPGVIRKDILSGEKVAILKELQANDVLAMEMADVLNMRLRHLDQWTWTGDAVPVDSKRHLNGKYRFYMDEDILDALFVHYIGMRWAVHFKQVLRGILNSEAWKSNAKEIPKEDRDRRKYFLNSNCTERGEGGIAAERKNIYRKDYFMAQLPDGLEEGAPDYDADSQGEEHATKDFVSLKHQLLHNVVTEATVMTAIKGEFTIVQSDFTWFGASLAHTTLLSVLKFFGMPEIWLDFFRRFLEAPLRFTSDGPNGSIRMRKNGVPLSHAMSDWMGETLLFCMDFAVNQYADGTLLYRLHDDFWFWGDKESCAKGWKAITDFTTVMGLQINESKSGTAQLSSKRKVMRLRDSTIPFPPRQPSTASASILPKGQIKFGFLVLNEEEGRFVVDQSQIDAHIKELKIQLDGCKSIFSWVRAWNAYVTRFFSNNFGKPAECLGRQHIDMVLATLKRVEQELFAGVDSSKSINVTAYLRRLIAERFDVHDLPDAFFYFPAELGGLELRNPFIPLLIMRENLYSSPARIFQSALADYEDMYNTKKSHFEIHGPRNTLGPELLAKINSRDKFMSLEEYMRYPETEFPLLQTAYTKLMREAGEPDLPCTAAVKAALTKLPVLKAPHRTPAIQPVWNEMDEYWKWIAELYHAGMIKRYGGLAAIEHEAVPLGVIRVFKEGKMRWHG